MKTELRYFDGEEVIKLIEGENGVASLKVTEDNKAVITMDNGYQRTVISPYIEIGIELPDLDEDLDVVNNVDF